MQTSNREDSNLRSFLNYLLVDKGLSNNTVKAYKADISSFFKWLDNEDLKYKKSSRGPYQSIYIIFISKEDEKFLC